MPSSKKVGWAQLRVGLMAIVALVILGFLIFLLTGDKNFWSENATLLTYLDDSAALAAGVPVRLNGIVIGKVERVDLSGESAPGRIIRVTMSVDKDYFNRIPDNSRAAISAENVLGTKFINIKRGDGRNMVKPGGEIPALDTREFEEVVQQGYTLLSSLQGILKRVDHIVGQIESGRGSIGKLLVDEEVYNRLNGILADGKTITAAMSSDRGTIGKLLYDPGLYDEIRGSLKRVDTMIADIQAGKGSAGKLLKDDALYDEARKTIAEIRKTVEDVNAGKGTVGKLMKDQQAHDQLMASMRKLDQILDKVNSGQGTLGQLLVNPSLYDSLNGTTREMQSFMKDFRANPKKFLSIKLGLF